MSFLSLSDHCVFLNSHLEVQSLLAENHAKMQALLRAMASAPWGKTIAMDAYVKKLDQILKGIQYLTQKEWGYLLDHHTHLQCLAPSERKVEVSHYPLIWNSYDQLYSFLEDHYLQIQILLAMMSSQGVWSVHGGAEAGFGIFARYLSLNQSLNTSVLKAVRKIIEGWEALCAKDRGTVDILGDMQFHNLIAYCNRWGREGS